MAKRFNIRMAGVGGQGVVTGSHILSTAVINAGGESTIVPFYGSEKRMAPVESYVRVSDEAIYTRQVLHDAVLLRAEGRWRRADQQ
jgi:pyruvate ferredoxin oxidoreductase gamma subunit